jgi:hypothetical protein
MFRFENLGNDKIIRYEWFVAHLTILCSTDKLYSRNSFYENAAHLAYPSHQYNPSHQAHAVLACFRVAGSWVCVVALPEIAGFGQQIEAF